MKKFAADNLLFLRDQYPNIYEHLRNKEFDRQTYVNEASRNGQTNLYIQKQEEQFYLYSRYNPSLEAERWVESLDDETIGADNILVFGFGLGYHLHALIEAYPEKRFYVYEPEQSIMLAAIESVDIRPILACKQIALFAVGTDASVHSQFMVQVLKSTSEQVSLVVIPPYRKMHKELINLFVTNIHTAAVAYRIDLNTINRYRKEWAENLIMNMDRNLRTPSFHGLLGSCEGIPAVVVGSGPSLGMEIEKLRAIQDHVVIIAAGSSIQGLLHHGIEPHLLVSMDAGEPNRRVFANIDVSNIPFLYIPMIKHTAIRHDRSPYLMHAFFEIDHLSHYFMKLTQEDGIFASTTTVTGTAIQAAIHLGCKDIIFIGQDFSYPNDLVYTDGVTHSTPQSLQKRVQESEFTVENVCGGTNRTNRSMINLKKDMEAVIETLSDYNFYNASPVGAMIEGTQLLTFEQVKEKYPHLQRNPDWFKQLVKEKAKPISKDRARQIISKFHDTKSELDDFLNGFSELDAHIAKAAKLGSANQKQLMDWFVEFDRRWSKMLNNPIYMNIYAFFLAEEQTHAQRNWQEMMSEEDLQVKLSKLLNCIIHLVEAIRVMNPIFQRSFEHLHQTLVESQE